MKLSDYTSKKFLANTAISLSALVAGFVVKKGFDMIYEKVYSQDPPDQQTKENVDLVKFLAYSVITGVVINLVKNSVMRSGTVLVEKDQGIELE